MSKFNRLILTTIIPLLLISTTTFAEKVCIKNKASLTPRGKVNLLSAITKVTGTCPARTTELFDLGNTLAGFARIDYDSGTDSQTIASFGGTGTTSVSVERAMFFVSTLGFSITFNGSYPQLTAENSAENRAKVIATASAENIGGHGPVLVTEASSSRIKLTLATLNEDDPIAISLSDWNVHVAIAN